MSTSHVLLTLTGAGFELLGLALVVLDARDARRRASEVVRRDVMGYLQPIRSGAKINVEGVVVSGRELTLVERVEALEERLSRARRTLEERVDHLEVEARQAAARASGEARSQADDLDRELRSFLAGALSGGRTLAGVAFFVLGVAVSAAANLVAWPICVAPGCVATGP